MDTLQNIYLEKSKIIDDYKNGWTLNKLAIKYKHNNLLIRKILTDNGVRIKQFGEHAKKHTINENYFYNIDTHEKAYLLGLIYADGNIYINSKRPGTIVFQMAVQKRDKCILEFIKKCINSSHKLHYDKVAVAYRINISNNKFCNGLIKSGVTPRKSLTLKFPDETILPNNLKSSFILGYFDGDGSISYTKDETKRHWSFSMIGTEEFLNSVILELKEKINTKIKIPSKTNNTFENVYTITWSGNYNGTFIKRRDIWNIYNYLYNGHDLGLKRKKEKVEFVAKYYKI